MTIGVAEIAEIITLIDASACEEFILELPELKLVLRRRGSSRKAAISEEALPAPAATSLQAAAPARAPRAELAGGQFAVRAPMVGTFYRRPAPEAPPFVEIGSKVRAGDALCLIEVMKLFTTLQAEREGTILAIDAEDGELVESGRLLFVLEPA